MMEIVPFGIYLQIAINSYLKNNGLTYKSKLYNNQWMNRQYLNKYENETIHTRWK